MIYLSCHQNSVDGYVMPVACVSFPIGGGVPCIVPYKSVFGVPAVLHNLLISAISYVPDMKKERWGNVER